MPVPLLDLNAQYAPLKAEIMAELEEVLDTLRFRGGPKVDAFQQAIQEFTGAAHAIGVNSGTDALWLPLRAWGIGPGDEVITTTFTFFATAGAIANVGATPVFVDIDPETYNIDVAQVEAKITEHTKAIVPVHIYGQCADMDPILELAKRHNLLVLEDSAQALGATYKGRNACAMGDAAAISFYVTKNLGAAGEGGMVVTNNDEYAEKIRLLQCHGSIEQYHHLVVGTNSHLDAMQAAVLNVKLKRLADWNDQRRANAAYYDEQLADVPEITTPLVRDDNVHVYHQYVIRVPQRDKAREFLLERGIGCAVFYPGPLHKQACFGDLPSAGEVLPEAEKACTEVLALPIFAELTQEQQDEVVQGLKDFCATV